MCRGSECVMPEAELVLAALLRDITVALAAETGTDPDGVVIGPVDFGTAV